MNDLDKLNEMILKAMDKLDNKSLKGEALDTEIHKCEALAKLGTVMVNNNNTKLSAAKVALEYGLDGAKKEIAAIAGNTYAKE